MNQRSGRSGSGLGFSRRGERERLLFIASAGLAFSLLVITLVVLNYRTSTATVQSAVEELPEQDIIGTVSVLTFDQAISAGTKLTGAEAKESFWRRDKVPEGAVFSRDELKGKYAKSDIAGGQVITRELLTTDPIETSLSLTPGFRAVSIDVDAVTGLEGHALPGTRVDVLITFYEEQRLTTSVVVQNARVLSYAGNVDKNGSNSALASGVRGRREVGRTITLEVSPKDALKIRTASQIGKLSLIMRSPSDTEGVATTEVDATDIGAARPKDESKDKCVKQGTIRIGGQEYTMDCQGKIRQMVGFEEQ